MTDKMYNLDIAIRKDSESFKILLEMPDIRASYEHHIEGGDEIQTLDISVNKLPGDVTEAIIRGFLESDDIESIYISKYVE